VSLWEYGNVKKNRTLYSLSSTKPDLFRCASGKVNEEIALIIDKKF
jgi:hypothetical protein